MTQHNLQLERNITFSWHLILYVASDLFPKETASIAAHVHTYIQTDCIWINHGLKTKTLKCNLSRFLQYATVKMDTRFRCKLLSWEERNIFILFFVAKAKLDCTGTQTMDHTKQKQCKRGDLHFPAQRIPKWHIIQVLPVLTTTNLKSHPTPLLNSFLP
jgi:hypothetical protein